MVIRIGGGDMNAIMGLVGFILGILVGIFFLKKNFSLGRAYKQNMAEGLTFPVVMVGLFVLAAGFAFFRTSLSGPGSNYAPWIIALLVALVVGALAQRSRLCMVGGLRDAVLFKEFGLLSGFVCILIAVLVGNAITGNLKWGFAEQPIAHTEWLWNMLGMSIVGWGCCLLGGCPLRQLVLAGEGNTDSAVTVFGMILGGALAHTMGIASSGTGTGKNGPTATIICLVILAVVSITNIRKEK
jgi:YedE family putative selenium metabolism protein